MEGYTIHRCLKCGHGFLHPAPSQAELNQLYDTSRAEVFNSNAFALVKSFQADPSGMLYYYRWFLRECLSALDRGQEERPRVLEVDCGCGVFLRCLKDVLSAQVLGLEINPHAAEVGRQELGVPIEVGTVDDLPPSKDFDLILLTAILEHLPHPEALLAGLIPRLRPGGSILILVPNFRGVYRNLMGRRWLWYMPPYHLHHFTPESMRRLIAAAGGRPRRMRTLNTGTYLFLIHYLVFGRAKEADSVSAGKLSLSRVKRLDNLARLFLSPLTWPLKLLDREAHIVAWVGNE
ncbi:MAG: class I SAM-dependent methyltransferase [Deltaproteobacteria bacterium]|nr:class I SAM-dependent methyltransferase [Deltaproteobacteria bacterium]